MRYWKINCMEANYPGLWQTWFIEQVAAIGWPPQKYPSIGGQPSQGWGPARKAVAKIERDDRIIVQLKNYRLGRMGTVIRPRIQDADWNPTVPAGVGLPHGEMGRRIEVKWDLKIGPLTPAAVLTLPKDLQLRGGKWRQTIAEMDKHYFRQISIAMQDSDNWSSLIPGFAKERSISEYIAEFPWKLEDGLRPYPSASAREQVFADRTRSDVLLLDKKRRVVIVECKQGSPTKENIDQLRGYMRKVRELKLGSETNKTGVRGILVHGGARKLSSEIREYASHHRDIEMLQFDVDVNFSTSA